MSSEPRMTLSELASMKADGRIPRLLRLELVGN